MAQNRLQAKQLLWEILVFSDFQANVLSITSLII